MYPNGISHSYGYDAQRRLTNVTARHLYEPLAEYAYAREPGGHCTSVREFGGRSVQYGYDAMYRLTNETVAGAPIAGSVNYRYDDAGNRVQLSSTLAGVPSGLAAYNENDWLASDTYDANGNTIGGLIRDPFSDMDQSVTDTYDFENHLTIRQSAFGTRQFLYDGDGCRVGKTVNEQSVRFLVDDRNPSGYPQVLEELGTWNLELGTVLRAYSYGLDLISQFAMGETNEPSHFFVYDGHGSVRALADSHGTLTDTYDYDAFGTLICQQARDPLAGNLIQLGTWNLELGTKNDYLFAGEQYDPDLSLYFLRARYYEPRRGRFWTMDEFEGDAADPLSLNKYAYCADDPVNLIDPTGRWGLDTAMVSVNISVVARNLVSSLWGGVMGYVSKFNVGYALNIQNMLNEGAIQTVEENSEIYDLFTGTYGLSQRTMGAIQIPTAFVPAQMASASRLDTLKIDLDVDSDRDGMISDADDSEEIAKGGLVCLRNEKCPDCREPIVIQGIEGAWNGYFLLKWDTNRLNLFAQSSGGAPLRDNAIDNKFPFSPEPMTLWVEGLQPSLHDKDAFIKLVAASNTRISDLISFTVVQIAGVRFKDEKEKLLQGESAELVAVVHPSGRKVKWEIVGRDKDVKAEIDSDTGLIHMYQDSAQGSVTVRASDLERTECHAEETIHIGCGCGAACQAKPGFVDAEVKSIDLRFGLGSGAHGLSSGELFLRATNLSSEIYSPAGLEFSTLTLGTKCVYVEGVIRQILAPKAFVDILSIDSNAYAISFYQPSAQGAWDELSWCYGVNTADDLLISKIVVENPDSQMAGRLRAS
ncbi:MAG: RHS repeat-associated core domain-containing protein, partial [Lentisphaerota bacterium]